ncbi:polysaccharide pyruvyl transferase family protein [Paludicola sp. MB14-C6]|uniref:polysaccharide pyruvyl transferase family protein n=1 Tax=Paludihabitans sp. MB14-C6 TaxID=3070656 RepID=UPI0027DBD41E|nr:polysaccharide pyruvyl transferase family protein [Paludicola sp. MB14-C6]WMJ22942.1 polysaccharide pyruvyl transferase family protein [Paludicola sp. MB14-C6]
MSDIKTFILFSPAISSLNIGDEIIVDSCKKYLKPLLHNSYVVEFATHVPVTNMYMSFIGNINHKFVLGSNLLMPKMNQSFRQWDIKSSNINAIKPIITMGVGWHSYSGKSNHYTEKLYKSLFNHEYINSVRDQYTVEKLRSIGVNNVINTACPSLWGFTDEFCDSIPTKKSDTVICTLTDYRPDVEKDKELLSILSKNYKRVLLWVQSQGDIEYISQVITDDKIEIVSPSLATYDSILANNDVDYVGTRLHGGIRALQHKKRSFIVAVDNRANEIHKDCGLPIIQRENLEKLEEVINSEQKVSIDLPRENIRKWLAQFNIEY